MQFSQQDLRKQVNLFHGHNLNRYSAMRRNKLLWSSYFLFKYTKDLLRAHTFLVQQLT